MKPLILTALTASLLLTACGGGSTPAPKTTKYQGVWGWGVVNAQGTLIDNGVAIFDEEVQSAPGLAAVGAYANVTQSRLGFTVMGPITAPGALEVGFTLDTNTANPAVFLVGQDSDNTMGSYQGMPTFDGFGAILPGTGVQLDVNVILIQTSSTVPTATSALAAAKANARAQTVAYAATHHAPLQAMKLQKGTAALRDATLNLLRR